VAHGPVGKIAVLATDNSEAQGIRVKSLKELLTLSLQTGESRDTYLNFKNHHTDRHGSDGIRNPSTTWGLALLAGWLTDKVIALDTYIEGSRRNPF